MLRYTLIFSLLAAACGNRGPCPDPSERLDLPNACFDGVCWHEGIAAWQAVHGEPDTCFELSPGVPVACTWNGLTRLVEMNDNGLGLYRGDGAIVDIESPYDGRDLDGLGVGAKRECFDAALGPPDAKPEPDQIEWDLPDFANPQPGRVVLTVTLDAVAATELSLTMRLEE